MNSAPERYPFKFSVQRRCDMNIDVSENADQRGIAIAVVDDMHSLACLTPSVWPIADFGAGTW